ncbi:hypothetical protein ACFX4N_23770 [Priestia sp. YIM B13551]|uniref:hypothetical protein n=1 Tax=Priestia sp. YIM B13551 TaxID=3366306 RepID=UPI0036718B12
MNILKWKGLEVDPMKISESITTSAQITQVDTAFNESTSESGITVLYPKIEAIHEGRTRNFNRYTAEKLKGDPDLRSGVYSWTAPYPKPVIHNHDTTTEATGRVYSASYSDYTSAGRPGIIVTPKITQEKAIKDIMEGRLLTVSIGASTNAAVCSVCGTDIINEGWCGHMRGEEYDGQVCEWVAGDLFFDELSWVNVPADSDAMIVNANTSQSLMGVGENTATISAINDSIEVTASPAVSQEINVDESTYITAKDIASTSALTAEPLVVTSEGVLNTTKEASTVEHDEQNVTAETMEEEATVVEETEETIETQTTEETTEVEETQVEESTETEVEEASQGEVVEETEDTVTDETVVTEQENESADEDALKKAQDELAEAQNTINDLTEANVQLAKELQEATVNFLVDLRVAVGKESNREEAVQKFATRTVESLRDSISDILSEKPSIKTTRTVEHVEKPTGQKVVTESKDLATSSLKVTNNEDALYNLLTGHTK